MKKLLAALLALSMVSTLLPLNVPASTFEAAEITVELPNLEKGLEMELNSVSDGMFSTSAVEGGISINGFTADYLNSLSEEEKQNISITVPAVYGDKDVVAIGDRAFLGTDSRYTGCKFTFLDLSEATNLKTIGQFAFYAAILAPAECPLVIPEGVTTIKSSSFYNCSGFTGDLLLPDSIESIDGMAFDGCTGLNGTLKLPNNEKYTTIAQQLVYHCKFTGTLVIPEQVTQIGSSAFRENTGFTGDLVLPEGITSIGGAAFSDCTGFNGELKLSPALTAIGNQAFKNCKGLSGVLIMPDSITSVGSEAFYSCTGLQTVYLPNNEETVFTNGSAFNYCSSITALVCADQTAYEKAVTKITNSAAKKLLGYPVTISFDQREDLPALNRLYGRPLNLEKEEDSGLWKVNADFVFPEAGGESASGYEVMWSFTNNGQGAKPDSLVQGSVLYQSMSLLAPVITQTVKGVSKEYDGQPFLLEIDAQHALKGNGVTIYYDWHKVNHYTGGRVQWSTNNSYAVQTVADSAGGDDSWYQVTVYAYKKGESSPYFTSGEYYFDVNITKGTPQVNVQCNRDVLVLPCDLPELALAEGSTPGIVFWDEGQETVLGEKEYTWTFVPEDADNYNTVQGSISLIGVSDVQIHASAAEGGSISPSGDVPVPYGTEQVFEVTPDTGYKVDQVLVDGVPAQLTGSSYTFENVTEEHSIEVTFRRLQYTITTSASEGGKLQPGGVINAQYGETVTVALLPDPGYEIAAVQIDGVLQEEIKDTYIFDDIAENHRVEVLFQRIQYSITATAGEGGSVSPAGETKVTYGGEQAFEFVTDAGYEIDQVLIDHTPVEVQDNRYVFKNITENHSVEVTFKRLQYSISATAGEGGTISPDSETILDYGSSQTYIFAPKEGYEIEEILVDGQPVAVIEGSYTFSSVTENHTIAVLFRPVTFTVTAQSGEGGSITPSGTVSVIYGQSQEFIFTPSEGYHLLKVSIDDEVVNTEENKYVLEAVKDNHKIYAEFEKDTAYYKIQSGAGQGGTISPAGETIIESGGTVNYIIQPEQGYQISYVLVDGQQITVTDGQYTFEQVSQDHTIEVVFEKIIQKHQVIFNANGGRGTMEPLTVEEGRTITLPANTLVYDGYSFIGWALQAEGPVSYSNQALFKMQQSDISLYAVWKQNAADKFMISGSVTGEANSVVSLLNPAGETLLSLSVGAEGRFSFEAVEGSYIVEAQNGTRTDSAGVIVDGKNKIVIPSEIYLNLSPVKTEVNSTGEVSAVSSKSFLDGVLQDASAYTPEDQEFVKNGAQIKFALEIAQTDEEGITAQEQEAIDAVKGEEHSDIDSVFLRIGMNKISVLSVDQEPVVASVEALEKPVPMTLVLPERFDHKEVTKVIQTYQTSDGQTVSELLPVLEYNGRTITVETSHFGLFTILAENIYTVSFTDDETIIDTVNVLQNQKVQPPQTPVKAGFTFLGWYQDKECTLLWDFDREVTADTVLYAGWSKKNTGGGGSVVVPEKYIVKYEPGQHGTLLGAASEKVQSGNFPQKIPQVEAEEGYRFIGWTMDGKTTVEPEQVKVNKDIVFTALYEKIEEIVNRHESYIQGDGTDFYPDHTITRAETAMMFYRVLGLQGSGKKDGFTDVKPDQWYAEAVYALAAAGILNGYEDRSFRPQESITRAEFAAVVTRAAALTIGDQDIFRDVPASHWAHGAIAAVAQKEWITGYPDGTFGPEKQITRAEAVKILNAMLSRNPDRAFIAANKEQNPFKDLDQTHWAYYEIIEAAVSHEYSLEDTEKWTSKAK